MTTDVVSLEHYEGQIDAADAMTAKQAWDVLERHYPDYIWGVNCSWETGMLDIRGLDFTGQYGFRVKLRGKDNKAYSASALEHEVMLAAGEVLERFAMRRGRMDPDRLMADITTDNIGRVKGDLS